MTFLGSVCIPYSILINYLLIEIPNLCYVNVYVEVVRKQVSK